jgi:Fe-S cluster biogenesis protein NfuA
MTPFGLRQKLKDGIKRLMGDEPSDTTAPNWQSRPAEPAPAVQAAPVEEAPPAPVVEAAAPAPATVEEPPAPVVEPVVEAAPPRPMAADDDTAGPAISFDKVQDILDDMVRPALQGDGGDIRLIKVEDNNIYVKLVGSCSTCPSSIMTMKMGVEALLKEEFPMMNELVQVD